MGKLKSWFYDSCKSFSNAGYQFHGYIWLLPAIFPLLALLIIILMANSEKDNWMALYNISVTQLMFFTIITSILNMATINKIQTKKENSSNDFLTSLFIALIILVSYISFSYYTFILNKTYDSVFFLILIAIFTLFFFFLALFLYSKHCENFNKNSITSEKLSNDKQNQEIKLELSIEQDVEKEKS